MKNIIFILTLLINSLIHGQIHESIRAGRPGQSIGPFNVYKGILQFQQGLTFSNYSQQAASQFYNSIDNTLRLGLTKKIELNSSFSLQKNRFINENGMVFNFYEFADWTMGFRGLLVKESAGIVPAIGLQINTHLPIKSSQYCEKMFASSIKIVTLKSVCKKVTIITNNEISINFTLKNVEWTHIINVGCELNAKASLFVEYYSTLSSELYIPGLDGGFAYLITDNIQIDTYFGGGKRGFEKNFFVSSGISWRLNLRKRE